MQLFLIIFVVILVVYFFLYFFRTRKKKLASEELPDKSSEQSEDSTAIEKSNSDQSSKISKHKNDLLSKNEWIVLKLVAFDDKPYQGYEMVQTLLAEGLRFGKMNIFHRHEKDTEKSKILFSLAQITKPGTFDLNNIGALECLGFTLFFSVKRVADPMKTFNLMVEIANNIAEELGGKLYTQTHQLLTNEQLQRLRCNVKLLQEKLHTPDLFTES